MLLNLKSTNEWPDFSFLAFGIFQPLAPSKSNNQHAIRVRFLFEGLPSGEFLAGRCTDGFPD